MSGVVCVKSLYKSMTHYPQSGIWHSALVTPSQEGDCRITGGSEQVMDKLSEQEREKIGIAHLREGT